MKYGRWRVLGECKKERVSELLESFRGLDDSTVCVLLTAICLSCGYLLSGIYMVVQSSLSFSLSLCVCYQRM